MPLYNQPWNTPIRFMGGGARVAELTVVGALQLGSTVDEPDAQVFPSIWVEDFNGVFFTLNAGGGYGSLIYNDQTSFPGEVHVGVSDVNNVDALHLNAGTTMIFSVGLVHTQMILDEPTVDTETTAQIHWMDGVTNRFGRVSVGPADSGGVGFRLLRVPNP